MATLTNISKNTVAQASGGSVFFGWLFLFTFTTAGQITNIAKNAGSLTNIAKS